MVVQDKFVQRGAASFVAQLRDTKDNSDVLVSLILTKEMLLVAKKPRYATREAGREGQRCVCLVNRSFLVRGFSCVISADRGGGFGSHPTA